MEQVLMLRRCVLHDTWTDILSPEYESALHEVRSRNLARDVFADRRSLYGLQARYPGKYREGQGLPPKRARIRSLSGALEISCRAGLPHQRRLRWPDHRRKTLLRCLSVGG